MRKFEIVEEIRGGLGIKITWTFIWYLIQQEFRNLKQSFLAKSFQIINFTTC